METKNIIQWKVEGMDCATCALTINKFLTREGMRDVRVNFATGDVSFDLNGNITQQKVLRGLEDLGYRVLKDNTGEVKSSSGKSWIDQLTFRSHRQRFWFCLPFSLVLMLHMIPGIHEVSYLSWLMDPLVQLALCLPVYWTGMRFFGVSAYKSLRNRMPNMNVLIALGATAAFVYSLYGTFTHQSDYIFYETAATVITLVFLGNWIEEKTIQSTQSQLNKLAKSQVIMANMIAYDAAFNENIFPVESTALRAGDLILIKAGEQVPADCKILWGEAGVNEAIITGESLPVAKGAKDLLIGGSVLVDGTVKAQVTAVGEESVLSGIIHMVKSAQGEKPPVQQMADKISAVFIPVVIGIAALTFIVNLFVLGDFTPSLMRAIAVLVIACPCAMGLATPAAIAVGLGRGARNGILFRDATSLENFKNIRQVVFDKTGTLTTGDFTVSAYRITDPSFSDEDFKNLVYAIEKYSNHPMAKSLTRAWKSGAQIRWKKVEEVKGKGVRAEDKDGNEYWAGSYRVASGLTSEQDHQVYITRNNLLIGFIDLADEIRPEARQVVDYFRRKNIRTILLSGDRNSRAHQVADNLHIDEVIAEKTPEEKWRIIGEKNAESPVAMVGDGINDAPALAKATIGISMSDASEIAMQTAQVVLMGHGLKHLPTALGLGRHTYQTIQENLFWAFSYNIIAIPVAAFGLLTPMFGALVMAFSDVVLAMNSGRLAVKKLV